MVKGQKMLVPANVDIAEQEHELENIETGREYKPSKGEIYAEVYEGFGHWLKDLKGEIYAEVYEGFGHWLKDFLSRGSISEKTEPLKGFGYNFGGNLVIPIIGAYFLPTARRLCYKGGYLEELWRSRESSSILGFISGAFIDIAQVGGYCYFIGEGHPEYALIPFATNLTSYAFEKGKVACSAAEQRLLEKRGVEASGNLVYQEQ